MHQSSEDSGGEPDTPVACSEYGILCSLIFIVDTTQNGADKVLSWSFWSSSQLNIQKMSRSKIESCL